MELGSDKGDAVRLALTGKQVGWGRNSQSEVDRQVGSFRDGQGTRDHFPFCRGRSYSSSIIYTRPENRLLVCEASQEKNSTRQLLGKTRVWHQSTRGSSEETTTEPCLPFPAPFASTRPWTPHLQPTISTIPTTSYRSNHDGRWWTQKLQGVWTGVHCRRAVQCHKGVGPGRLRYRVVCGRHAVMDRA